MPARYAGPLGWLVVPLLLSRCSPRGPLDGGRLRRGGSWLTSFPEDFESSVVMMAGGRFCRWWRDKHDGTPLGTDARNSENRRPSSNLRGRCFVGISSFAITCVAATSYLPLQVAGWWDAGHMLVGGVARELLTKNQVDKLEAVLKLWENDYPGLSSLVTAPVWADHIKCSSSEADFCRGLKRYDSIELFDQWHWVEMMYNPQNLPLNPAERAAPFPSTGAVWALQSAFWSLTHRIQSRGSMERRRRFAPQWNLETTRGRREQHGEHLSDQWEISTDTTLVPEESSKGTKSSQLPCRGEDCEDECDSDDEGCEIVASSRRRLSLDDSGESLGHATSRDLHGSKLSLNLELRLLLHIMGDLHQPLHAIDCVSKLFRGGDLGGGMVPVKVEGDMAKKVKNLHQLWDSVAGTGMLSWPYMTESEVIEKARDLIKRYPKDTLFDDSEDERKVDLKKVAEQSHKIAIHDVYAEFDWETLDKDFLPYHPSPGYIARSVVIAEKQIVRGGFRLARMLRFVASHLPPLPKAEDECAMSSMSQKGGAWKMQKRAATEERHPARLGTDSTTAPRGSQGPFVAMAWYFGTSYFLWFVVGASVGFIICFLIFRNGKAQVTPGMTSASHYCTLG